MEIKPSLSCFDGNVYNDMTVIPKPINICKDKSWNIYEPNDVTHLQLDYLSGNQVCNWFL